jgi:hypothetical protein
LEAVVMIEVFRRLKETMVAVEIGADIAVGDYVAVFDDGKLYPVPAELRDAYETTFRCAKAQTKGQWRRIEIVPKPEDRP